MKRPILALIAGLIAWVAIVSVLDLGLRALIAGYAAGEPTFTFTPVMLWSRLALAAIASLASGALVGWIAPASARTPWILGVLLLALFLPEHVKIWPSFPVWYHLTFLLTLAPLVALGARLAPVRGAPPAQGVPG
jgi:hypothetical protein